MINRKAYTPDSFQNQILKLLTRQEMRINQLTESVENLSDIVRAELKKENQDVYEKLHLESLAINKKLEELKDNGFSSEDMERFAEVTYQYFNNKHHVSPKYIIENNDKAVNEDKLRINVDGNASSVEKQHLIEIYPTYHTPYHLKLSGDGFKNINGYGAKSTFTMPLVLHLKHNLKKYAEENCSVSELSKMYGLNYHICSRLIWNIEEGYFDDLIDEYESMKLFPGHDDESLVFNYNTSIDEEDRNDGVFEKGFRTPLVATDDCKDCLPVATRGYRRLYTIDYVDGVTIYRKGQGKHVLLFNLIDVAFIKRNIPMYIREGYGRNKIAQDCGLSVPMSQRIIFNIQEGVFDDYLPFIEDKSEEHSFKTSGGELYIDGAGTGLTLDMCSTILLEYNNAGDKLRRLNKLVKRFREVDSRFIVIVVNYLNEGELSWLDGDVDDTGLVKSMDPPRVLGFE